MEDIIQYCVVVKDNTIHDHEGVIKTYADEHAFDNPDEAFKKYLEEKEGNLNFAKEIFLYKKITSYVSVI